MVHGAHTDKTMYVARDVNTAFDAAKSCTAFPHFFLVLLPLLLLWGGAAVPTFFFCVVLFSPLLLWHGAAFFQLVQLSPLLSSLLLWAGAAFSLPHLGGDAFFPPKENPIKLPEESHPIQ